jgi:hypothetical protein
MGQQALSRKVFCDLNRAGSCLPLQHGSDRGAALDARGVGRLERRPDTAGRCALPEHSAATVVVARPHAGRPGCCPMLLVPERPSCPGLHAGPDFGPVMHALRDMCHPARKRHRLLLTVGGRVRPVGHAAAAGVAATDAAGAGGAGGGVRELVLELRAAWEDATMSFYCSLFPFDLPGELVKAGQGSARHSSRRQPTQSPRCLRGSGCATRDPLAGATQGSRAGR